MSYVSVTSLLFLKCRGGTLDDADNIVMYGAYDVQR
jgi:hypothetical protein